MSTQYLDKTGLTYFWGKLKDYFQAKLVSGTNIKTVNNQSLLGSGNIAISAGTETDPVFTASAAHGISSSDITNWNGKTSNTGTVTKVTAGTGLSVGSTAGGNFTTSGTLNHTNSVTAQTTQGVYPIKIDACGHISAYGSAASDYVTDKGTSGSWAYRKWNSGKVEAWYSGEFSFGATTKATNVYYADGTLAIPSGIFTSTPNCIASSVASSAGAINSAVFALLCLGSSSTSLTTRAFRVSANSSSNWKLRGNVYAWTD